MLDRASFSKPRHLTPTEKEMLKNSIIKMTLPNGRVIAYCIANKQSNSGLFSNERLLLLHGGDKSIRYYSKLPDDLPFTSMEQIREGKEKVCVENVNPFRCQEVKGKTSTFLMKWESGGLKKSWTFTMRTAKMMNQWINLVSEMLDTCSEPPEPQPKSQSSSDQTLINHVLDTSSHENPFGLQQPKPSSYTPILTPEPSQKVISPYDYNNKRQQQKRKRMYQEMLKQQQEQQEQELKKQQILKEGRVSEKGSNGNIEYFKDDVSVSRVGSIKPSMDGIRLWQGYEQQPPKRHLSKQLVRTQSHQPLSIQPSFKTSSKRFPRVSYLNNSTKWNQLWCSGEQDKVTLHERFIQQCKETGTRILDQYGLPKQDREYIPTQITSPYHYYKYDNIQYIVHCFSEGAVFGEQSTYTPLLYNHQSYNQMKREFNNFNYILAITGNQGPFKVPLCYYMEYKGMMVMCKAAIPSFFDKVAPHQHVKQICAFEELLKMTISYSAVTLYLQPQGKYFLIGSLDLLLPRIPGFDQLEYPVYFRPELLISLESMIDSQASLIHLRSKLTKQIIPQFIHKLESLQFWIINCADLHNQLQKAGINPHFLSTLMSATTSPYFRQLFLTQAVAYTLCQILHSELNNTINTLPEHTHNCPKTQDIDNGLLQCTYAVIQDVMCGGHGIWKTIVRRVKDIFGIVCSKEDILPGMLLGGIIELNGVLCDFKCMEFSRNVEFFSQEAILPRSMLIGFVPIEHRYNITALSPQLEAVQQILSQQPCMENFQHLLTILKLPSHPIPSFCHQLQPQILTYICNFIPLGQHDAYNNLSIYSQIQHQPHTFYTTKICLLGIKWAIKHNNIQLAESIFELKIQQNGFWVSEFNPAISQFYDLFAVYYVSIGHYNQAIKLAKSSLINCIKLLGTTTIPIGQKHYQLASIYFKINKKQDAFKQYQKAKQIYEVHKLSQHPTYIDTILKLAVLNLNFGKINDCITNAHDVLMLIQEGQMEDRIHVYELLSRAYEIVKNKNQLYHVANMCMDVFSSIEQVKYMERILKVILTPYMLYANAYNMKGVICMLEQLERFDAPPIIDCFNYIHQRTQYEYVNKRIKQIFDNGGDLALDVQKRELMKEHRQLATQMKDEAAESLVLLEAIAGVVGYSFLLGMAVCDYC